VRTARMKILSAVSIQTMSSTI